MNDLRVKPLDLCMSEAMPFQQHYELRTTHPIADVAHDQYFLPVRGQIYAGDQITICRFDKADATRREAKLLEVGVIRIVESGANAKTVPVILMGPVVTVTPAAKIEPAKPDKADRPETAAPGKKAA